MAKEDLGLPLLTWPEGCRHFVIPVEDSCDENLLTHFDRCVHFITSAIKQGGRVLVSEYLI